MGKRIDCIEYLSVDVSPEKATMLEDKQRKCIREYVRNKRYVIVKTVRRNGLSKIEVDKQWRSMVNLIKKGQVQGIVVTKMDSVTKYLPEALDKIGQVIAAGGKVITVDDGEIMIDIKGDWR